MLRKLSLVAVAAASLGAAALAPTSASAWGGGWHHGGWHHHHYGYWHGERGYWQNRDHKHEFVRVSPELGGFRTRAADKGITFNTQYVAEV